MSRRFWTAWRRCRRHERRAGGRTKIRRKLRACPTKDTPRAQLVITGCEPAIRMSNSACPRGAPTGMKMGTPSWIHFGRGAGAGQYSVEKDLWAGALPLWEGQGRPPSKTSSARDIFEAKNCGACLRSPFGAGVQRPVKPLPDWKLAHEVKESGPRAGADSDGYGQL